MTQKKELARLLKKAHLEYEKSLDGSDDEWAKWYTAYIRRQLEEWVNKKRRKTHKSPRRLNLMM